MNSENYGVKEDCSPLPLVERATATGDIYSQGEVLYLYVEYLRSQRLAEVPELDDEGKLEPISLKCPVKGDSLSWTFPAIQHLTPPTSMAVSFISPSSSLSLTQ